MSTTLLIISYTVAIALFFGGIEAAERDRRIKDGDREELPHGLLVLIRILVGIAVAFLLVGFTPVTMLGIASLIPAAACTFAITHRITFNWPKWWWMGPKLGWRHPKSSKYDWLWHHLAWWAAFSDYGSYESGQAEDAQYPDRLPFYLATGLEVVVIVVNVLLVHLP